MAAWNPRANEIFLEALEAGSAEACAAILDRACGPDAELRERVEGLLRAHEEAGSFLGKPVEAGRTGPYTPQPEAAPPVVGPAPEGPGSQVGPYKLVEEIGEGGMGSVFLARQQEPVKRLVAVKLIKAGMDSRQVLARFEQERQALALMDHPNIAKVHDAGTTENGRPYFVMELVKGVPITRFCDEQRLTPRQRLALFVPVCSAIQHAHQKGIIHRDVKPSNVMVTLYDGKPVAKVIDFGVAKATEQKLTERSLFTQYGTLVGTFEYMSPEQAEMSDFGVDTRSDIFSLGVLLYELLTGNTPLTHMRVKEAAYAEILRLIKEEEPPRPSTRLSDSGATLASISAQRHMEPAKLTKLVRGELDWIVMKALEKDRNRRYETTSAFAADVRRYLADEPVQACPPSVGYRFRKFVRRNRGPVLAASLVVLALMAGVVGTTIGLVRAEQRAEGERRAKDTAEKRLAQVEKGIDLLGSLFADLDPFAEEKEGRPLRAILGDRLDQAAAALEGEVIGDPLVVAKLQDRLGQTYLGLGHARRAEALFTKALATRQDHLAADHPLTLDSRHNQALAYEAAGKRIEAITQFKQVRAARVKVLGSDHPDTLSTQHELAVSYYRSGKPTEAISLLEQVRDGRVKQLGEDHDHTLATLQFLAQANSAAFKHPEAIALAEKVRDAWVKKHGDDHPHAIDALAQLANVYQAGYKMRPALALYEQAEKTIVPKLGRNHPQTLRILYGLGHMYRAFRRTPEAIALLEQLREREMLVLGAHHPGPLHTLWELAMAYLDAGERGKALPLFQQAAIGVERLEFAHDAADRIVHQLASCHEHLKQYDQAEVWRRKWVAVAKVKYGPESFQYVGVKGLMGLGSNLLQQKKYADAEPILRESVVILQKNFPGWDALRAQSLLGAALLGQQKYAAAEPHLVQGYQGLKKLVKSQGHTFHAPSDRQNLTEALERVVQLYDAMNKPDEAAKWRKELEAYGKATEKTVKPKEK